MLNKNGGQKMGKKIVLWLFGIITISSLLLFLGGCNNQDITTLESSSKSQEEKQLPEEESEPETIEQEVIENPLSTQEPSEMVLELRDLPKDWFIVSRSERVKSDISDEGLEAGWRRGYMIIFGWQDEDNPFVTSTIGHLISIYPIESLKEMINQESTDEVTYEELSNPNIGEESRAYKVTDEVRTYYEILFYKKDVLVTLDVAGVIQDYELLKELARKAEKKIR